MTRPMIEELLASVPEAEREMLEQGAALVLLATCADPGDAIPGRLKRKLHATAQSVLEDSDSD
jgi:hypothetical protein